MTPSWRSGDRTRPDSSTGRAARGAARPAARRGRVGQVRARLETDSGQVLMLRLEIKQLGEKIEAAIARRQADEPPAPYWLGLSREEHAARLAELRAWVEQVGRVQYRGYFAKLPPCWPAHPEAVIELSTVMTEWIRIYGDPDNRPLQDALVWNDKWLPGVLGRLGAAIRCDVSAAAWRVARRGSVRRPATPDRPEGPGVLPLRRGLLRARLAVGGSVHLGCQPISISARRSAASPRTAPERCQAATTPQGTASAWGSRTEGSSMAAWVISARSAARSASCRASSSTLAPSSPTSSLSPARASLRSWLALGRGCLGLRLAARAPRGAVPGDLRVGHRGQRAAEPRPGPAGRRRPGRSARPSAAPTPPGRSAASRAAPPRRRPPRRP